MKQLRGIVDKYRNFSPAVKASLWFTICNVLQKGISMITVPIFTRILSTEQYGIFSVYQSWYSIVTIFATLNLYSGVFNVGMSKYSDDRENYLVSLQSLCTVITSVLFIVYMMAMNFWNNLFELSSIFMFAMFLELFFAPAITFWGAKERYNYKYIKLIFATLVLAIGSPLLGVIAVLNSEYKAEARVVSYVFVQVSVGLFFYIVNCVKARKIYSTKYWKFAFKFNITLLPHYLSQIVLAQSDRLMINKIVGSTKAAIYSVTYNVSSIMQLVTNAINSSFVPYTYDAMKEKKYSNIKRAANGILILIAFATVIVMLLGPEVISVFAPEEYYEAIWAIPPVSASIFFSFLYPLFGNIEFYFEENRFVTFASIGGAVLNIILNYILIPLWGYITAGYTTLICYILYALCHYFFMKKVLIKHGINEDVYDKKGILIISTMVIISMLVVLILYPYTLLRWTIIVVSLILAFIYRKKIINILTIIRKK